MRRIYNIMVYGTLLYLIGMAAFWFCGEGTKGWNVAFYTLEKGATCFGFICLYLGTTNRKIRAVAAYMSAVSVFMFAYYLWCYAYGHDSILAMGSLLIYSFLTLVLINHKS